MSEEALDDITLNYTVGISLSELMEYYRILCEQ
jgi:hypothetical protein